MLGIDRRAASTTWTAALVLLLLCLVYLARVTLFIFVLALLFAYVLSPLVNLLDRFLPARRTRTPALGLAYLLLVGVVIVGSIQIGSRAVDEANNLASKFPTMLAGWQSPIPESATGVRSLRDELIGKIRTEVAQRSSDLISELPKAGLKAIAVASDLIYVVIIPILGFFFLKDAPLVRQHILDLVTEGPRRALLDEVLADINLLLAGYMRALVLLSLATFTVYGIFFSILGVPYAVLLAALAGLLEFVPMIGPLTAGAVIVVVAALAGAHGITVLIFLVAYRLFQDYILSPHVMARGVELHPLLVMFGVFAGAEVAGIPGAFLSVPILALARILYLRIRKARLNAQILAGAAVKP
ncbi:MAG: AI-2E family transporter [Acidobacteriia bacterium]|nr:AI-2E family transporter [Terriglobia bacterium]